MSWKERRSKHEYDRLAADQLCRHDGARRAHRHFPRPLRHGGHPLYQPQQCDHGRAAHVRGHELLGAAGRSPLHLCRLHHVQGRHFLPPDGLLLCHRRPHLRRPGPCERPGLDDLCGHLRLRRGGHRRRLRHVHAHDDQEGLLQGIDRHCHGRELHGRHHHPALHPHGGHRG